jgi:AraC-like DNA-binding protein
MFMGALQGFLLFAALLRQKSRKSAANLLLAVLMFLTAVRLVHVGFSHLHPDPGLWDWSLPLILTFSPLLYLYCRALLGARPGWKRGLLVHFAPALVYAAWRAAQVLGQGFADSGFPRPPSWLSSYLPDLLWLAQTVVYLALIRGLLGRYAEESPRELSDVESVRLTWIRVLAAAFAFLCGLIVVFLAGAAFKLEFIRPSYAILYISVAAIVFLWGWFGMRQSEIFLAPANEAEAGSRTAEPAALPSAKAAEGLNQLLRIMDERSPHLDPRLTLHDLARASGLPPYQLTALLNGSLGLTFYEFINRRRIEEAKHKLADPAYDNVKILAVALDSGFASKSAFNRVFRDVTGQTPSVFRKSLRSAGSSR